MFCKAWLEDASWPKKQETVNATQVEAGLLAQLAAIRCTQDGKNFVFDATLQNAAWNKEFMSRLRCVAGDRNRHDRSLRICIIFVDTTLEICRKRVADREITSGRRVD